VVEGARDAAVSLPARGRLPDGDRLGMEAALDAARRGAAAGEVPVGAAVVVDGRVVADAHNETIARRDLTQHAELLAMRGALGALGVDRLENATLYITLEPCAQCAGAIVLARVGKVVFGAYDPKAGMAGSVGDLLRHPTLNHRPEVQGGVMPDECGALLTTFFERRR
jgi:tRNA(adenine34) deaminase